ncbi:hypothetical protein QZH41_005015 [Actinostola sp. cb2023]|nr:hypothetical protein QZH41_005015 [Actinostola sp. cb2023]
MRRSSMFHKEVQEREQSREDVYHNAFLTLYWLAKEELPNKKFNSLIDLTERLGVVDMKFFEHRSSGAAREMFLLLATHITLHGPEVKYSSQLIQDSVKQWKVKPRRKIAKGKEAARPAFSDAAVQADLDPAITPNLEILQQEAELLEKEAQMLEEEAEMWEQEVNSALKILNLPQPDTFSDSSDGDSDDKE